MTGTVNYKKTERFILLYSLYRKSNVNTSFGFDMRILASQEGLGQKRFKTAFDYLCKVGFVKPKIHSDSHKFSFYANITNKGIEAIEEVCRDASKETQYFPSFRDMRLI